MARRQVDSTKAIYDYGQSVVLAWLSSELGRRIGLPTYDEHFVRLFLNGRYLGTYTRQRRLDESLLIHLGLLPGPFLRLESGTKVIIGRTQDENEYLESLFGDSRWLFKTPEFNCASVYAVDDPADGDFTVIAALSARYGKGVNEETVAVVATKGDVSREFMVQPARQEQIEPYFIAK